MMRTLNIKSLKNSGIRDDLLMYAILKEEYDSDLQNLELKYDEDKAIGMLDFPSELFIYDILDMDTATLTMAKIADVEIKSISDGYNITLIVNKMLAFLQPYVADDKSVETISFNVTHDEIGKAILYSNMFNKCGYKYSEVTKHIENAINGMYDSSHVICGHKYTDVKCVIFSDKDNIVDISDNITVNIGAINQQEGLLVTLNNMHTTAIDSGEIYTMAVIYGDNSVSKMQYRIKPCDCSSGNSYVFKIKESDDISCNTINSIQDIVNNPNKDILEYINKEDESVSDYVKSIFS